MSDQPRERFRYGRALTFVLSAVLGIGLFGAYPVFRDGAAYFGITLPREQPYYTSVILVLSFVIVGLGNELRKAHRNKPRLVFGPPESVITPLYNHKRTEIQVPDFCLVWAWVKNDPRSEAGRPIEDAHCKAEFLDADGKAVIVVEHVRWDENRKPRYDETPSTEIPRYRHDEMAYRKLKPNGDKNNFTFAVKDKSKEDCFGFAGASQDDYPNLWQSPKYRLRPGTYRVRITVRGSGGKPGVAVYQLRNRGAGHALECSALPVS